MECSDPFGRAASPSVLQKKQRGEAGREEGKPFLGRYSEEVGVRSEIAWDISGRVDTRAGTKRETCMNVVFDGQFRNVESSIAAHERTSRAGDDARRQRKETFTLHLETEPHGKAPVSALSLHCASVTPLFRGLPFPSRCEKPSGTVCCGIGAHTK